MLEREKRYKVIIEEVLDSLENKVNEKMLLAKH